jgi:hypothetical protein
MKREEGDFIVWEAYKYRFPYTNYFVSSRLTIFIAVVICGQCFSVGSFSSYCADKISDNLDYTGYCCHLQILTITIRRNY